MSEKKCTICGGSGIFTYRKKVQEVIDKKTGAVNIRVYEKDKDGNVVIFKKPCECQDSKGKAKGK
ncbi:MAG: hypothetical protein D4S01_03910 [Dehalococcoidia bacterium]|nr:MAG: hypothetical protein D4S01_03910 [Dehalococcoidia bacterium]